MKIIRCRDYDGNIVYAAQQANGSALKLLGDIFVSPEVTSEKVEVAKLLAPVQPCSIICIGLNYRKHAEETGAKFPEYPVVFFKGINTLQHPGEPILLPTHLKSDEVDYECELAVVIGRACKNVNRERALDFVLGYTCCNDISARDWQIKRGGGQWSRGKTFDTFSPLGPVLVTRDEILNPNSLKIRTILDGRVMQDWNTNDMIFDVPALIEFLSGSTTLLPGTVILTGTPHGVGMAQKPPRWLRPGDQVSIEIEKIGVLTNPVAEEP
ncbi:MAG TPA: fumarylacetoacetate hydrolase family protein [Candidatus Limnocylindrales bacterium]|nr:fumarylacetoacetate hydrolase family protein [Candidatus Limnocylindrales bacterium]